MEQRFPWNDYVDVRFSISNTLDAAKGTNIIARLRGFYDGQMMLDMDHLYLAKADGSPDLTAQFFGGGEAILTIPAPADKGFFIINPKPDVPSNRSGRPDTADIQHD